MHQFSTTSKAICVILVSVLLWDGIGSRLVYADKQYAPLKMPAPAAAESIHVDAVLSDLQAVISQGQADRNNGFAGINELRELRSTLAAENRKAEAYFRQVEETINDKELPAEIRERHTAFVESYRAKYETMLAHLGEIEAGHRATTGWWGRLIGQDERVDWDAIISQTTDFLAENSLEPRESHFDPQNLPHRSLRAEEDILPKLTAAEWEEAFPDVAPSAQPTADDLAETIEVQFTPEITQLAADLDNNPVQIFNWVRNNIEFVPIWGSIQGAHLCLETRVCNAFDTSSLLIALFRASGIPARYQMGTIEVPTDRFMNWAGGFTDPDAAASFFATGSVPSVVRRIGLSGEVLTIRLEHVWVKAFVDYTPSGGAINIEGDTWVDLDPSFKQYVLATPPADLTTLIPFNRDDFLDSSVNQSPLEYYQQILTSYISQNYPGMTLEDFITRKSIVTTDPPLLPGNPPFILVAGISFSDVPNSLRQQLSVEISTLDSSNPLLSFNTVIPSHLNKRFTLSFMPASASDVETAEAFEGMYFAPPHLLLVKPVLRVNGTAVVTGEPVGLGQGLNMTFRFEFPNGGQKLIQNKITAGVYSTILVAPHIITDSIANALAAELDPSAVDDRFGTLNIDNSDRDQWIGGGLQSLGTYFFNQVDSSINLLKALFPIAQYKTVFEAIVSAEVQVSSLFGTPRELQVKGVSIDADLAEDFAISKDGMPEPVVAFEKLRGLESSYWEHASFEVAGMDPERPAISTVNALKRATADGTQIFEINADNLAEIEPFLQISETDKEAVLDAVNAGLEVTIPENSLQFGGWRGVGFIAEDPLTGAGAYLISGGFSGGVIELKWPGLAPGPVNCQSPCKLGSDPPLPNRPTAIIAIGYLANCTSLRCIIASEMSSTQVIADTIGQILFSQGYNTYIDSVTASEFADFVNFTGDLTSDDVFMYIGHGRNGKLRMRASDGDPSAREIAPGQLNRKFKISLLTACATGGLCPNFSTDDALSRIIFCQADPNLQFPWNTLVNSQSGSAIVGYFISTPIIRSNAEAVLFWNHLANGFPIKDIINLLEGSYYIGDGDTTLPFIP